MRASLLVWHVVSAGTGQQRRDLATCQGELRRSYLGQLLLHSTQAWQRATHASRHAIMRAAASWARRLRLCLQRNTTALHWVTLQLRHVWDAWLLLSKHETRLTRAAAPVIRR
mmetsp:Transcript_48596/g.78225  ORF Transcript_48596/g.78225 Transcript_48596/m.78225 type:complete len:113 (+) Transcript_48596:504-842(+)